MRSDFETDHCKRVLEFALLALLVTDCSRPDEQLRARVRGNLHKIDALLWKEMSRLNTGSEESPPGLTLPAEVGRHAKGAFLTPIPPKDNFEKLLTLSDGLVHEQYDVLADRLGFQRVVTCGGPDCVWMWTPEWMEIRGFALSGPQKTVECMSLKIGWRSRDVPPSNPRKVTNESSCPSSSWQEELAP